MQTENVKYDSSPGAVDDNGYEILGYAEYTNRYAGIAIRVRVPVYPILPEEAEEGDLAILWPKDTYLFVQDTWVNIGPIELPSS